MSINFRVLLLCGLMVAFGAACSGGAPAEVLPTTTPRPTDVIPTSTPTPLPPPTVTPFPTGSGPGSSVAGAEDEAESGTEDASDAEGAENVTPDPAATAGTQAAATATTPASSGSSGSGFPQGVTADQRLFSADFAQGWPTVDDATANIRIQNGQYAFDVGPFDARFINTSTVDAANIYAEVDVNVTDCPVESGYGLIFRFVDSNNYFAATIFCNNTFSVVAKVSGSIVGDPFPDGALPGTRDASSGSHTIGILSVGNTHTLYFDGQVVTSFEGAVHEQGDVAMYIISRGESIIRVAFDNLEVWTAR